MTTLRRAPMSWPLLGGGAVVTLVLAHSVHVVMFDVLGIPSAPGYPLTGIGPYLTYVTLSLAALVVCALAFSGDVRWGGRWVILFLLTTMLRGQLIRAPVMDGTVTGAWRYALLANAPTLVPFAVLSGLLATVPVPRQPLPMLVAAFGFAAAFVGARAAALRSWQPVLDHLSVLAGAERYHPPYDWHVDVPSYLSFAEPVAAGFGLAWLVWDRLDRRPAVRLAQFVLLLMALDRTLFGPIVYVLARPGEPGAAVLSFGQFWLQSLTQAVLTGLVWATVTRRVEPRPAG